MLREVVDIRTLALFRLLLDFTDKASLITTKFVKLCFYSRLDEVHELWKHSNILFSLNVI
jgi:hypothetical protein